MLNSIDISYEEFNEAFEGNSSIIFKEHNATGKGAEFEEISHHMFVPETLLTGATYKIEKFQKNIQGHPLAMIQTALGIPRQADWSYLPLALDANGTILQEKSIPSNTHGTEGAWLRNLKEIKSILCSKEACIKS